MTTPPPTWTPADLTRYFEHSHQREFKAGDTIISAGAHSNTLYYVVTGSVTVMIEDHDGHEFVLAYLNAGDFFGEIGMFDERHERSAWVRARVDCEIAELGYDRLRELTRSAPDAVIAMIGVLSLRLRDTSRKVRDLAFMDVAGRVARALLDLRDQPDVTPAPGGISVQLTRQELGRIVGCSREMASRVLRELEERGMVRVDGRRIIVLDH